MKYSIIFMRKLKKNTIKCMKLSLYFIIILSTVLGAVAFSLDSIEDSYTVTPGDEIEGTFIIEDYQNGIKGEMDLPFLSFKKSVLEQNSPNLEGKFVATDVVSVSYYINVPKDADIGVYRGLIKTSLGNEIKYLNIKISVQNGFISTITRIFKDKNSRNILIGVGIALLLIILAFQYKNTK